MSQAKHPTKILKNSIEDILKLYDLSIDPVTRDNMKDCIGEFWGILNSVDFNDQVKREKNVNWWATGSMPFKMKTWLSLRKKSVRP